jgi:hypothetical protein
MRTEPNPRWANWFVPLIIGTITLLVLTIAEHTRPMKSQDRAVEGPLAGIQYRRCPDAS